MRSLCNLFLLYNRAGLLKVYMDPVIGLDATKNERQIQAFLLSFSIAISSS